MQFAPAPTGRNASHPRPDPGFLIHIFPMTRVICLAIAAILHCGLVHAQTDCLRGFQNPQDKYPHTTAQPAGAPFAFKVAEMPLGGVKYRARGESGDLTLDEYLKKFCTTGLLVLKDDTIVFERYLQRHF